MRNMYLLCDDVCVCMCRNVWFLLAMNEFCYNDDNINGDDDVSYLKVLTIEQFLFVQCATVLVSWML